MIREMLPPSNGEFDDFAYKVYTALWGGNLAEAQRVVNGHWREFHNARDVVLYQALILYLAGKSNESLVEFRKVAEFGSGFEDVEDGPSENSRGSRGYFGCEIYKSLSGKLGTEAVTCSGKLPDEYPETASDPRTTKPTVDDQDRIIVPGGPIGSPGEAEAPEAAPPQGADVVAPSVANLAPPVPTSEDPPSNGSATPPGPAQSPTDRPEQRADPVAPQEQNQEQEQEQGQEQEQQEQEQQEQEQQEQEQQEQEQQEQEQDDEPGEDQPADSE